MLSKVEGYVPSNVAANEAYCTSPVRPLPLDGLGVCLLHSGIFMQMGGHQRKKYNAPLWNELFLKWDEQTFTAKILMCAKIKKNKPLTAEHDSEKKLAGIKVSPTSRTLMSCANGVEEKNLCNMQMGVGSASFVEICGTLQTNVENLRTVWSRLR